MVDLERVDVIHSTIAVLITAPERPALLDQDVFLEFLQRPVNISQGGGQFTVDSPRDQISLTHGGNKLNVRDLSGRNEFGESRVPAVVHSMLAIAPPGGITAYGINFDLIVSIDDPARWAADNLVSDTIKDRIDQPAESAGLFVRWRSDPKNWNIRVEPSPRQDGIRIDFNADQPVDELPNEAQLLEEMSSQFEAVMHYAEQIGL